MNTDSGINTLKGVGDKTRQLFEKVGVKTVGDLLNYYPQRYEVYEEAVPVAELQEGQAAAVTGAIFGRVQVSCNRNLQITTLFVKDITGILKVVWFRMPFLRSTLSRGGVITLRGRISLKQKTLVMEHPEIFYPASKYAEKKDTLQPVYSLTAGLTNNAVQKAMAQALNGLAFFKEYLPADVLQEYQLVSYPEAIQTIHFPAGKEDFYRARERLVFDEFIFFTLSIRALKENRQKEANPYKFSEQPEIDEFIAALPYELTKAQRQVWEEMRADLQGVHLMNRLVQGDVGCGKTIVSLLGLIFVGLNGCQGALMVPTEVLARQHYENITGILNRYHINLKTALLTGSMTAKEKKAAYTRIGQGEVHIIIGTHALIQEKVTYHKLALVVTDEQHRFGVKQRETFADKGNAVHVLVMSATPIPRTLAVILYGDLDISVINELPRNRLPIKNCVVDTDYRETAYKFIHKEIAGGRQCYIICPMVEESESVEAENVIGYTQNLQEIFPPPVRIAYLHGKMNQAEKDRIMEEFGSNQIQILVSTTVIEVGIDVPNATIIMIENAERFGLAQLHQLRGRVGRGQHQSYCIFMSPAKKPEIRKRLEILNKSNDGFFIAGEDLRLRGPGDIFGIRQSGIMDFALGDVYQDAEILKKANEAAGRIIQNDPELVQEDNHLLREQLQLYLNSHIPLMTL